MNTVTLLRPEARPFGRLTLDHEQNNAVDRILQMLNSAIEMIDRGGSEKGGDAERSTIWELDPDRSSRIVLLSGERGTGKTTVLLSMMQDCREARKRRRRDSTEDHPLLRTVAERTIWLEPLDMETLPPSTNLLAAILARVENAARKFHVEKTPGVVRRRGLIDEERENDPLITLRRLQRDVAISWEGNLEARRGSLDPDAYAVEVLRAERSRLSLNESFSAALDVMALRLADPGPLFVLPVDDFDLNPSRSLELLRFLRAISVPRLFSIVLGDTKVAEVIINLRLAGEFAELADRATSSSLLPLPSEEIRTMSGELASQIVRKLIPPSQVLRLQYMTVPEALNYAPPGGGVEGGGTTLFELLKSYPVALDTGKDPRSFLGGPRIANLADFLFIRLPEPAGTTVPPLSAASTAGTPAPTPPGASPSSTPTPTPPAVRWVRPVIPGMAELTDDEGRIAALRKRVSDPGVYRARRVFQTSPRRLVDFSIALQSIGAAGTGTTVTDGTIESLARQLLDILGRSLVSRITEDSGLTPAVRHELLRGLARDQEGTWTIEAEDYIVEPRIGSGESLAFAYPPPNSTSPAATTAPGTGTDSDEESEDEPTTTPYLVHTRSARGWVVRGRLSQKPAKKPTEPPAVPPRLEEGTAELFMFFQDFLNLATPRLTHPTPLMWTTPEVRRWATTEWRSNYASRVEVTWPTPPFSTFWEYDLFLGLWGKFLDGLFTGSRPDADTLLGRLVFAWIDAATAVVSGREPVGPPGAPTPDWTSLVKPLEGLVDVIGSPGSGAEVVRGWLINVTCLLMPEMIGIRPGITDRFASSPKLKDFWKGAATDIRLAREGTCSRLEKHGMEDLAKDFRDHVPSRFPGTLKPNQSRKRRPTGRAGTSATPRVKPKAARRSSKAEGAG